SRLAFKYCSQHLFTCNLQSSAHILLLTRSPNFAGLPVFVSDSVAEGVKINAHRNVLVACSNYFKAMFTSDMVESRKQEIEMVDMKASTLESLVNFCYSGTIKISASNVLSVLPAACQLQLNEIPGQAVVIDQCCEFLKNELTTSNCLGIRAFADTYACPKLFQCANKYILNNFQDVVNTEEFHQLPVKQIVELISSDELVVITEEQ
ncbi:BTB/POZ domain protein, partial [Ostertagia ostertagi]